MNINSSIRMKRILYLKTLCLAVIFPLFSLSCQKDEPVIEEIPQMPIKVPTEGNSWFYTNQTQTADFKNFNWVSTASVMRTFFRVESAGSIHIGIKGKVNSGTTKLKATFQDETKELEIESTTNSLIYIGSYTVSSPGYYHLDLQGIERDDNQFAEIEAVALGGDATSKGVHFSNEDYFYWGRRGPSVHLGYEKPSEASNVLWFYNEVTVPANNDVIGSYYMANGFGQGYFGMQVNSATERRILFSVWSPYTTDDPSSIPEDKRVVLLSKGDQTTVNDFGGEGSGGQSYLKFNWKVETTYRFLLKGEPSDNNKTDYTAYFYDPTEGKWHFIASWRRPETSTYLTGMYSFLENFATSTGPIERMVHFNNQWIYDTNGKWHEITRAKFTADPTARDKARLDYAGGYKSGDNGFYLKNCGFFNETSELDIFHTRPALGQAPDIDFDTLPTN